MESLFDSQLGVAAVIVFIVIWALSKLVPLIMRYAYSKKNGGKNGLFKTNPGVAVATLGQMETTLSQIATTLLDIKRVMYDIKRTDDKLLEMHEVYDDDHTPVWHFKKSLREAIVDQARSMATMKTSVQQIAKRLGD